MAVLYNVCVRRSAVEHLFLEMGSTTVCLRVWRCVCVCVCVCLCVCVCVCVGMVKAWMLLPQLWAAFVWLESITHLFTSCLIRAGGWVSANGSICWSILGITPGQSRPLLLFIHLPLFKPFKILVVVFTFSALPPGEELESSEWLGAATQHLLLFLHTDWRGQGEDRRDSGRGGQRGIWRRGCRAEFSITSFYV